MADIRISSRKVDAGNGRSRRDFSGELHSDTFGIVFSHDSLILNLTDGKRNWAVIFGEDATQKLSGRFAERLAERYAASKKGA